MIRVFFWVILTMLGSISWAQNRLISHFDMDDCELNDRQGGSAAILFGPTSCTCGVVANGIRFDGDIMFAQFPGATADILSVNFSMSFYVQFDPIGDDGVDLFHLGAACTRDSIFSVRYFPSVDQMRVRLSDSPGNEVQLTGDMDPGRCWNYIVITKSDQVMQLYVNSNLEDEGAFVSDARLNTQAELFLANSPCLTVDNNRDVRFRGKIDELSFYNYPLTPREIMDRDLEPDQIITNDTTIFIGTSALIQTGGTCASDFEWSPTTGLNDAGVLNPVASPNQTTIYTLTIDDETCTVVDEVTINVVSREELTCGDLKLPSAFTPNDDLINDRYGISNTFLIDELISFEIFDKWGGRVYFTNQPTQEWDGMYKGLPAAPNSYLYHVAYSCGGEVYNVTGTVNLIR